MNWVHVHLILSHVPVLGCIFGLFLLLFALIRNSRELLIGALWILLISALAGIPTFTSGEHAENRVERLPGVTETIMDQHEETAEFALAVLETLGIFALLALILIHRNRRVPRWMGSLTLVLAVAAAIILGWTANLGGLIRHTEIRGAPSSIVISLPSHPLH